VNGTKSVKIKSATGLSVHGLCNKCFGFWKFRREFKIVGNKSFKQKGEEK